MNKVLKRIIIAAAVAVAVVAAAWGIITLIRNSQKQPVKVYDLQAFSITDYWGDSNQSYGMVSTKDIQKIYLESSQTVTDIFVSEGQHVSKGDEILAYDTTASKLDLQKREILLEKQKLALSTAQAELEGLLNSRTSDGLQAQVDALYLQLAAIEEKTENAKTVYPSLPLGSWSEQSPRYIRAALGMSAEELLSESGLDDIYAVFVEVSGDDYSGYTGVHFYRDGEKILFDLFEAEALEGETEDDGTAGEAESIMERINYLENVIAGSYTKAELAMLISEKQSEIKDLDLEIRISQVEYERKQKEIENGGVICEIDGIVKTVRDPEEAYRNSLPAVEISGGGGYYINATVSELELSGVAIGQMVDVYSWESGTACSGTVYEIGTEPSDNTGWSSGNNNVSWYPLIIFVDEDENLREYEYAEINYQSLESENTDSWYLENIFIRTENGRRYVYTEGEDGLLEKRFIKTGRDLWGSYTEIKGGLSPSARIAFPYGTDVKEGAETVQADASEFYEW